MRRAAALSLGILACTSTPAPPPAIPVPFRVIRESQSNVACVDAPDFAVAFDEGAWIDIFDRDSGCSPGKEDIELPVVNFSKRIGIAAWWGPYECRQTAVRSVAVAGADLVVTADHALPPSAPCRAPAATAESFLSARRVPALEAVTHARFVLDGTEVGTIPVEPG
jgi:hypothetical protein